MLVVSIRNLSGAAAEPLDLVDLLKRLFASNVPGLSDSLKVNEGEALLLSTQNASPDAKMVLSLKAANPPALVIM